MAKEGQSGAAGNEGAGSGQGTGGNAGGNGQGGTNQGTSGQGNGEGQGQGSGQGQGTGQGEGQGTGQGQGQGSGQPKGEGSGEGQQGAAGAGAGAPEKYELKAPEGAAITDDDIKIVEQIARAKGLTNEQAQAALDDHVEQLELQSAAFLEATKRDPELGGDKLTETLKHATVALDTLRPKGTARGDAFRQLLDRTGYGNHPEVIAFMAELGKRLGEDKPGNTGGGQGGGQKKTAAQTFYPDMPTEG